MTRFEFSTVSKILFGEGVFQEVGTLASQMGRRILVVTGLKGEPVSAIQKNLDELGCESQIIEVAGEPTADSILVGTDFAHRFACDVVVSLGGGSAIV